MPKVEIEVYGRFLAIGEHLDGGGHGCTFAIDQPSGPPIDMFVSMQPGAVKELAPLFLQRVKIRVSVEAEVAAQQELFR
jgi:hypothetical protein